MSGRDLRFPRTLFSRKYQIADLLCAMVFSFHEVSKLYRPENLFDFLEVLYYIVSHIDKRRFSDL